jgi:hypothetical protein
LADTHFPGRYKEAGAQRSRTRFELPDASEPGIKIDKFGFARLLLFLRIRLRGFMSSQAYKNPIGRAKSPPRAEFFKL